MSNDGYTPIFSTVFDGSLCGKWPDSAVWLTMLALCDKRGNVDMSYQAIAGRTGWPMDLLRQGVAALMQPDPESRSPAAEGRRLTALDPARGWGWHVVNHSLYREKARLQAKDAVRTASGADADRKRTERALSPEVPRTPPPTPVVPLSDSNADSDSNARKTQERAARAPVVLHESLPTEEWEQWLTLRRKKRWPVDDVTLRKQLDELKQHDTPTQREMINRSINAGWQGIFPPRAHRAGKSSFEERMAALKSGETP